MTKRVFFKLAAGIVVTSSVARLFGQMPDRPASGNSLTNWAGNYRYGMDNAHPLSSVEEVQKFVKEHESLRVLGTRHSFNGIADSVQGLISLKPMDRVVKLDPKARTVTVEAGVTYGQPSPISDARGFALHNLASLPHISVAGAVNRNHGRASRTETWQRRCQPLSS